MRAEATEPHTRIMKCALEVEEARAYWRRARPGQTPVQAFEEYWFGAKSLDRVKVLLANFRVRFDAFPEALAVLQAWDGMDPVTRALVCHWHLQLVDPVYRAFTGQYLVARRDRPGATVSRELVVSWLAEKGRDRWTMATRIQFASKLLSAAYSAGLVAGRRDPRPLAYPAVPDRALEYLVYLLRGVRIGGTLLQNPYLASVGLEGRGLEDRLRALPGLAFGRQADLVELGWRHPDLGAWDQ